MASKPISVSQLNNYVGRVLATDPLLMNIAVCGEIANLTKHSSGHWYFSLKDAGSKVNCFLSSMRVSKLRFDLDEGMQIVAYGSINVYEKGGYYSLNIKDVEAQGEGALQIAFEKLKSKLEKEGLFDLDHKKEIPYFPKKVGVITSPTGAAIRDIVTTIKRRNPLVDVLLYPALVQGEDSADSIANAIENMNKYFKDCDVLIVGRGGGSIEDLWSFNEEQVARAIYQSNIPVISAVGHEVDTVISDYVADLRAATPTAAAELAVPHIDNYIDTLNNCNPKNIYKELADRIKYAETDLKRIYRSCQDNIIATVHQYENKLKLIKVDIDASNPLNVLEKGYSALKDETGKWITSVKRIKPGQTINVMLNDGNVIALVQKVEKTHGK
ncbi:MAG: exodeoxyribonuclease VII large subunit [Bacillota bacterium]|nr:exodeoxyribonuclease VII large subunit [Bacillota bacterium]